MGSEKIFMFGEPSTGGRADLTAILPALMNNNKGIDPNILAMLGNRDGNGRDGFGNDFFAILLLFILMGWGGNNNGGFFGNRGNGGGEGLNILNNDSTRELLMSAIKLHHHKGFEWMFLSDYENLINKSKNSSLTDHD